ncbi:energy transducer TonB [Flavobacterium adhaerens]|uniref:energy transducer TonB n=1 Tax=Flavobacterium adhaerens TaxID=3149043 RepID=UPI0032B57BE9
MSKLNIFETTWINLVFENRNQEYGAYPLRQENTKTSFFALFIGVSLLTVAISIPMVYNALNPNHQIPAIIPDDEILVVTPYEPIIFNDTKPEEATLPAIERPVTENEIPKLQLTNPEIVQATAATTEPIATNTELKDNPVSNTIGTSGTELGTETTGSTGTAVSAPSLPANAILPSVSLDKKPEFPGGIQKFYNYVGTNFEKPELEMDSMIRITVSFVVEKDGSMTDIRVLKDPGHGLGAEAIRVLKSLKTKWSPGIYQGKPVRTSYNLPIAIQAN